MQEHIPVMKDIKRLIVLLRDRDYKIIGRICKHIEPPSGNVASDHQKIKRILRDISNEISLVGPRPPGYPTKDDEYVVGKSKDVEDRFGDEQIDKQKDSGEWLFCEVPAGRNPLQFGEIGKFRFGAIKRADICSICVEYELRKGTGG